MPAAGDLLRWNHLDEIENLGMRQHFINSQEEETRNDSYGSVELSCVHFVKSLLQVTAKEGDTSRILNPVLEDAKLIYNISYVPQRAVTVAGRGDIGIAVHSLA